MSDFLLPFTSLTGGLGRSQAIMTLAKRFTETGKRVLVVDLDLSSPYLSPKIAGPNARGVADYFTARRPDSIASFVLELSFGYAFLPAGRLTAITKLLNRIGGFGPKEKIATFVHQLRAMGWDYIFLDMPPGNLSLNWYGCQSVLRDHADAVCLFTAQGFAHDDFRDRLKRLTQATTRVPPGIMYVMALTPPDADTPITFDLSDLNRNPMIVLPRVEALTDPHSRAWRDPKYLSGHYRLADALLRWTYAIGEGLDADAVRVAITALDRSLTVPPTILRSRMDTYLHPRVTVLAGREGAGKTALAMNAVTAGFVRVSPDPAARLADWKALGPGNWEGFWDEWFAGLPTEPTYALFDSFDETFIRELGWPEGLRATEGLIKAAQHWRDLRGINLDVKVLVRPGTAYGLKLGRLLKSRQVRQLRWNKADLLQMALRRAIQAYPAFAALLEVHWDQRLSMRDTFHEDWTRSKLEAAADRLFGIGGLTTWEHELPPSDSSECELVPGEAAQILIEGLKVQQRDSRDGGLFISPPALTRALQMFAHNRYERTVRRLGPKRIEAIHLLRTLDFGATLTDSQSNSVVLLELLNWGLVHVDLDTLRLEIPPLVSDGFYQSADRSK